MRHCATSRKVAGSIPDGRTVAPGSTQPLTEMSPGVKGGRCVGLTTLPPSCADYLEIWEPQPPGTLWASQACNGVALPFSMILTIIIYYIPIQYCLVFLMDTNYVLSEVRTASLCIPKCNLIALFKDLRQRKLNIAAF